MVCEAQGLRELLRLVATQVGGPGSIAREGLREVVEAEAAAQGRAPEDLTALCDALRDVLGRRDRDPGCETPLPQKDDARAGKATDVSPQDAHLSRASAVCQVLQSEPLLGEVWGFLVVPGRASSVRVQLSHLACTCSRWRALATSDLFWRPISKALLPTLPGFAAGEDDPARTSCRQHVCAYGRALQQVYRTSSAWHQGLTMIYEVHDLRDGRRLFFGTGPIHVAVGQSVILRLTGRQRTEVSEPFTAADRDPGRHRFATVRDFFKASHSLQYPADLRTRVVLRDDATGRMALLYQSSKALRRHAKTPNASYWQEYLPANDAWYVWESDMLAYTQDGKTQMKLAAAFYCVPVDGEPEVAEERLRPYRIAGGDVERYNDHCSYVSLDFSSTDGEAVGRFVRELLSPAPANARATTASTPPST